MDTSVVFEPQNRWIEVHYVGEMTIGDIRTMGKTIEKHQLLKTDNPRIIDYTKANLAALDFGGLAKALLKFGRPRHLNALKESIIPSAHICVEPRTRALIGYWIELTKDDYPIRGKLFYDRESAESWILERIQEKIPESTLV